MKEHKTILHFQKCSADVHVGSLLTFSHFCLVFVPFSGRSLFEMKFIRKVFPLFFFGGFLNKFPNQTRLRQSLPLTSEYEITLQINVYIAGDQTAYELQPHTHTAIYQQLPNRTYHMLVDCYLHVLTLQTPKPKVALRNRYHD